MVDVEDAVKKNLASYPDVRDFLWTRRGEGQEGKVIKDLIEATDRFRRTTVDNANARAATLPGGRTGAAPEAAQAAPERSAAGGPGDARGLERTLDDGLRARLADRWWLDPCADGAGRVHARICGARGWSGFRGEDVARTLMRAREGRGALPERISVDNGTEFTSRALDHWPTGTS